mmetsp:Transcript_7977/g.8993  ORF Transcript_7977/g.8993 Transcript_7977/m.8993 type:complete len:685 (-) Transcript_7977:177-2231(-)
MCIVQNCMALISLLSRAVLACSRHRVGVEDSLDHLTEVARDLQRGFRLKRSSLDTQKVLARHRFGRLQNPTVLQRNWCETMLVGIQQAVVKLFLFTDTLTFDASCLPSTSSEGRVLQQHAVELRSVAARALHEASRHLAADLVPPMIRRALVPVIAVFLCVPPNAAGEHRGTEGGSETASALTTQAACTFGVQCPTLFDALTLPYLTEFIPRFADGSDLNFSASVGSVLDCRLQDISANGLGGIVRCACILTNLIPRRSQLHISFLHELGAFVMNHAKWRRPSGNASSDPLLTSDPYYLQDEDLILLVMTLMRKDVKMPETKLSAMLCRCFQRRRDLFGEAPTSTISIAGLSASGFATGNSGFQLHQLNLNSTAVREARHAEDARVVDEQLRRISGPRAALPDMDVSVQPLDGDLSTHDDAASADDPSPSPLQDSSSSLPLALTDIEATTTYETFTPDGGRPTSHRAAIQSLSFTAEQLFVLMLAYGARVRLSKDVRVEAVGLLRSAAIDRRERIANRMSRSNASALTAKEQEELFSLRLSNNLPVDQHYGIGVLHAHFAFRKIIHAASRKTGVVQAPHTLADIVEILHEVEEGWRDNGRCDGTLNATLNVLTEWALLRVEDAGCDGAEDRNQFVTPVGRLFGDMALKILKRSREQRENRQLSAQYHRDGGRKWRVREQTPLSK